MRFLRYVLDRTPEGAPRYAATVWLLNLAYMTIGKYPDGVPARYQMAPDIFTPASPFPYFENVATQAGLGGHVGYAGGTIVEKHLAGETLRVDTGCLVAFEDGIDYSIERAGNLKSMVFGGEGLFVATLSGSGRVWLQSLPFSRLADRIIQHAPAAGGTSKGQGSVLGGLGRLLD